jgi:hypothetical protein
VVMMSVLPAMSAAQTSSSDTKSVAQDTLKSKTPATPAKPAGAKPDSSELAQEMELEAIAIEAIIEKPNVDIIPKRVTPDLEEVEFVERSFDRELKEVPKDLLLLDDDLDRVAKLEGLKKLLEKKKK